jgi:hypothetical protein
VNDALLVLLIAALALAHLVLLAFSAPAGVPALADLTICDRRSRISLPPARLTVPS